MNRLSGNGRPVRRPLFFHGFHGLVLRGCGERGKGSGVNGDEGQLGNRFRSRTARPRLGVGAAASIDVRIRHGSRDRPDDCVRRRDGQRLNDDLRLLRHRARDQPVHA